MDRRYKIAAILDSCVGCGMLGGLGIIGLAGTVLFWWIITTW